MNEELLIYLAAKVAKLDASVSSLSGLVSMVGSRSHEHQLSAQEQSEIHQGMFATLMEAEAAHFCEQFPEHAKAFREHQALGRTSLLEHLRDRATKPPESRA